MRRIALLLCLLMAMSMSVVAFAETAEEAPAEEAPAEEAPAEEAAPAATGELIDVNGDGKITVAGIHKFGDSLWFVNESAATEARLKELGVDEYTFMDAKDDGNLFLQMIDTAIAQGVDGVITTPPDQTLSQVAVDKLAEAGIPVLASDDPLQTDDGTLLAPCVVIDAYSTGVESARWIIDYMKENGLDTDEECGIMLMTTDTVTSAVPRTEGQEDTIAELLPDFPAERIFYTDYKIDLNVAYTAANSIIVANPQIKKWMVLSTADEGTIGATRALEQAGLDKESCTVALGGYLAPAEFEKGTCCKATVYFSAGEIGTHAAENLVMMMKGETPALHLAEFRTQLRPCERQGEQGECREVQDEFQTPAPRRSVGHERTDGFEPAETAEAPACELSGGRPYGDEQREEPQQPEVFGICESEHYGRDFNQRVRNRNSTSSRARAAAAQRRYSSV